MTKWTVPSRVVMRRRNKLGDALSVLNGLEFYCVTFQPKSTITICNSTLYEELMDIFDYPHLKYSESEDGAECLDDVLFTICQFGEVREFWPVKFYTCLCLKAGLPITSSLKITKPKSKIGVWVGSDSDFAYVQLDGRSGKPLSRLEMGKMMELSSFGKRLKVIGGPDTKNYLGNKYRYELGDVKTIAKELIRCHHFIGVDSGIGHLAGFLNVPQYIVNTCGFQSVFIFFRLYSNVHLIDRDFISENIC